MSDKVKQEQDERVVSDPRQGFDDVVGSYPLSPYDEREKGPAEERVARELGQALRRVAVTLARLGLPSITVQNEIGSITARVKAPADRVVRRGAR